MKQLYGIIGQWSEPLCVTDMHPSNHKESKHEFDLCSMFNPGCRGHMLSPAFKTLCEPPSKHTCNTFMKIHNSQFSQQFHIHTCQQHYFFLHFRIPDSFSSLFAISQLICINLTRSYHTITHTLKRASFCAVHACRAHDGLDLSPPTCLFILSGS